MMSLYDVKPDIDFFNLLIVNHGVLQVLDMMSLYDVKPDIDFFNLLIVKSWCFTGF